MKEIKRKERKMKERKFRRRMREGIKKGRKELRKINEEDK